MHHTSAYVATIAQNALVDVTAISDNIITIQNGHLLPQRDMALLYAWAGGITMNRARLVSPSNRQITLPFLRPVNVGALPITNTPVADYRENPFMVKGLEELAVEALQTSAGVEEESIVVGLGVSRDPMPSGNIFTMRGSSVTAAVADTWTLLAVTWADTLPAGRYAMVGMEHIATTSKAARASFDNEFYRPGCVGSVAAGNNNHPMFRKGGLGKWGEFLSTRMPSIEVLCNAADAAHDVYIDLIKIG